MNNPIVAAIVANAITFFDETRYDLYAWCVMPNHVHKVLGRTGKFWQDDYWDRLVGNPEDLKKKIAYVVNNPINAALKN